MRSGFFMNGLLWAIVHEQATLEHFGFIPMFLHASDSRSAKEQINENYAHGGGWRPMLPEMKFIPGTNCFHPVLQYPGDPDFLEIGHTQIRNETVYLFTNAFVAIVQQDGSYEIARID